MSNKKRIKILLVILAVVAAGIIYSFLAKTETAASDEPESALMAEESSETTENESTAHLVCVHVCGAVESPGVYYLEEGSRIHEAVTLAGGLKENAAGEYINLAQMISDGQQIYIPDIDEVKEGTPFIPSSVDDGLVNINTASLSELKTIPGIGDTKAEAIISYRENVAVFASVEDIKNVAGIKESLYEKIKDFIKV